MERTHARPERPCGLTRRRRLAKLLLLAVLLAAVLPGRNDVRRGGRKRPGLLRILLFGQDAASIPPSSGRCVFPGTSWPAWWGRAWPCPGATMQGMMRNPMASPSILGVTSGASVTTYIMYLFFPCRLVPDPARGVLRSPGDHVSHLRVRLEGRAESGTLYSLRRGPLRHPFGGKQHPHHPLSRRAAGDGRLHGGRPVRPELAPMCG